MLQIQRKFEPSLFPARYEEEKKIRRTVERIVEEVFRRRDRALVEYTRKYDCPSFTKADLTLENSKIHLEPELCRAMDEALARIQTFAEAQKKALGRRIKVQSCSQEFIPLDRIGIYVPGKKAALFSSVLMTAVPAKVAGVKEIYLVSPPDARKQISPLIRYAAQLTEVQGLFRVGGAQAIAALAFGTETIPRVDKIVGPGNSYVQMAKKLVSGLVGIDTLAGPSEIAVLADKKADPEFIAWDMLAQAEHGEDSPAVLISNDPRLVHKVKDLILNSLKDLPRKKILLNALKTNANIILVDNLQEAVPIINSLAPEHVSLQVQNPERFLKKIKNAGTIFVGGYSPVAAGDYWAGPSHVLPTGGAARFSSALGVSDFLKRSTVIHFAREEILPHLDTIRRLAEEEKLFSHAQSLRIRKK